MDKDTAIELVRLLLEGSGKLDASVKVAKDRCTDEDFVAYRKRIAQVMGALYIDVMEPIFKEHPDARPPQL